MRLTGDEVKKVAKLANLPLAPEQVELYGGQLSEILDYMDHLEAAETSRTEPTFNVSGQINVLGNDVIQESLPKEEVLKNSANSRNGYFVTKGVFEDE